MSTCVSFMRAPARGLLSFDLLLAPCVYEKSAQAECHGRLIRITLCAILGSLNVSVSVSVP